jgi:hypothetical protein
MRLRQFGKSPHLFCEEEENVFPAGSPRPLNRSRQISAPAPGEYFSACGKSSLSATARRALPLDGQHRRQRNNESWFRRRRQPPVSSARPCPLGTTATGGVLKKTITAIVIEHVLGSQLP